MSKNRAKNSFKRSRTVRYYVLMFGDKHLFDVSTMLNALQRYEYFCASPNFLP